MILVSKKILKATIFCVSFFIMTWQYKLPAQNNIEQNDAKKFGIQVKGFIKSDYWVDTRQVVAAREDLFLIVPANKLADENGKDINAHPAFNFSAITSRVTGTITGPDAFGAKTSGMIEADFSGVTNADINGLRLRHAIGKLRWKKSELMFGQYWHPMFVPEVFPAVISLNTGAPFQPFIRNPLISYTRYINLFNINLTLLTQRDNANDGPQGANSVYLRNAHIPNVHLQVQYKNRKSVAGIAVDYKKLMPRIVTGNHHATDETIGSFSMMGYYKYTRGNLLTSTKVIFGQNLTEHLMLGGYAVHSIHPTTLRETYTPTNHLFLWSYIGYGTTLKFGIFTGYARNFGTTHTNIGYYYARGSDIGYAYRVAPSLSWISEKVQISSEFEYTAAAYGMPDNKGIVKNLQEIGNLRLLLTFFYFF